MPPSVVCLEFEGVLAETENVRIAAWERTFGDLGWDVAPEVCARSAGLDDREFLRGVFASRSVEGDVEGWVARQRALVVRMLTDWPRVDPGVPEFLRAVSGRARLAIVSTIRREVIDAVLRRAGLAEGFEVILAREDVSRPKPDPEAYQIVLKRLAISPSKAVAVESSAEGVASASAAGLSVVVSGDRKGHARGPDGPRRIAGLSGDADCLLALGFA